MPMPILALAIDRFLGRDRQNFFQLSVHRRHIGVRQIDLIDHRDDRQALFMREMNIGHGLRLHALGRIDDQQRAFAGRQAARNFVGKIDVPRRIDQVQPIRFARSWLV